MFLFQILPPQSRFLIPGVKLNCSIPFLCLVSVSFQKLSPQYLFSTPFLQLISNWPFFCICLITALLYIVLLTLCNRLQTQRICHALRPVSCHALRPVSGGGWDPGGRVPPGIQHASSARTSPRWVGPTPSARTSPRWVGPTQSSGWSCL